MELALLRNAKWTRGIRIGDPMIRNTSIVSSGAFFDVLLSRCVFQFGASARGSVNLVVAGGTQNLRLPVTDWRCVPSDSC